MTIKFTFYLKSGKVFDSVAVLTADEFSSIINTVKTAMTQNLAGSVSLGTSLVRLSECAVVDWEELDEPKTEKS